MANPELNNPAAEALRLSPHAFLVKEWPYFLVLVLALSGVAYTSFSGTPITKYWIILAPFIGLICVIARWRGTENREQRSRLVWTGASLGCGARRDAPYGRSDVGRMKNADASDACRVDDTSTGTFTAGVHIMVWRICLIGGLLALGVPANAWLEQSALLLLLVAVVAVAVIAPFFWPDKRANDHRPLPSR